ncbi:MAG: hypothetical protein JO023_23280 [Chloroflexi bacterium]|nr:hypothetical protein [Chloroflexota bacterium]
MLDRIMAAARRSAQVRFLVTETANTLPTGFVWWLGHVADPFSPLL